MNHLSKVELPLVGGLALLSVIWTGLLPLAIGAGLIFRVYAAISSRQSAFQIAGGWWLLGLSLCLILSTIISPVPARTIQQVMQVLSGIFVYFALADWIDRPGRIRLVLLGLVVIGIGLGAASLGMVDWRTKFSFLPEGFLGALSTASTDRIHPNVLAGAMVLLFPFLPASYFSWGKDLPRLFKLAFLASGLIMILIVITTQSRGAIVSLGVAFVVLVILAWKKARWWLTGIVALLIILVLVVSPFLVEWLDNTAVGGGSVFGRSEIWSRAISLIEIFPFTGVGMGAFADTTSILYPLGFAVDVVPHAHNLFLQIAVDVGIPGMICWLGVFISVIFSSIKLFRNNVGLCLEDQHLLRWSGTAIIASMAAMAAHGMVDAVVWGTRPAVLVWYIWGISAGGVKLLLRNPQVHV